MVETASVELDADRAAEEPQVFTRIHMHFVVSGRDLDPRKVERAIALSVEKYCSAVAMLEKTATITHDFELAGDARRGRRGRLRGAAWGRPRRASWRWPRRPRRRRRRPRRSRQPRRSRISSGWGRATSPGSTIPVGVALCRLVNQHRRETGLRCAARPSEGSVGNVTALRDGTLRPRHRPVRHPGGGAGRQRRLRRRPGRSTALRSVASLYPEPLTVVARADAGIAGDRRPRRQAGGLGRAGLGHPRHRRRADGGAGLDGGELRRRPRARRPTGWRTRSATARSTPSSMRSAIRRWWCRRRPPPATRCCSTWPGRRWTRWSRRRRPSWRRRSRPGSTAAPAGRSRPSASGRRSSPAPTCRRSGSTPSCASVFDDLDMLRGLDPVAGQPRPGGDGARRAGGAAASRGGALLPRAGLAELTSAAIPIACGASAREGV